MIRTNNSILDSSDVEYICLPVDEYNDKKGWYGYYKNIETEGRLLYE